MKPANEKVGLMKSTTDLSYSPTTSTVDAGGLTLNWLLQPKVSAPSLSERVLARLIQSEAHEPDVWLRDDYRQSQITVILASRGNTIPFVVSSYQMYGLHPDKVYPAILARREALLGSGQIRPEVGNESQYSARLPKAEQNEASRVCPVKKSVQSEKQEKAA